MKSWLSITPCGPRLWFTRAAGVAVLGLLAAAQCLIVASADAQMVASNDRVRIEVRVQSEQDRKDLAKTTTDTITQRKTLSITLSGKARSPESRTGKWTAYGRSLKGNDITVLESGEFPVALNNGTQTIETKSVTTTYTPEHFTVSGGRGRSRASAKKVAAEGTKFVGYRVVVKDGATVVGEVADPAGVLKDVAK